MQPSTPALISVLIAGALASGVAWSRAAPAGPADAWALLDAIEVEEAYVVDEVEGGERYVARKTYPEDLDDVAAGFEVTGHVVVLVPEPRLATFLLVERPEDCPFCELGEGAAALEVVARAPLEGVDDADEITVRGTLTRITDPDTYQAVRLVDAVRVTGG